MVDEKSLGAVVSRGIESCAMGIEVPISVIREAVLNYGDVGVADYADSDVVRVDAVSCDESIVDVYQLHSDVGV